MNTLRAAFEQMLKRRTSRGLAITSGFAAGAGLFGVSYRSRSTRAFTIQSGSSGSTPVAIPIDIPGIHSARFDAYPFQLGVASACRQSVARAVLINSPRCKR
ncbi:hypothetical protein BH20CHL2_BH20CHL2_06300 [soil metagenome]|jgi:hypothetical protein